MTLTQGLAIEGAVVGTASFVFLVRREFFDRGRLRITTNVVGSLHGGRPDLVIKITNLGLQPVDIGEVGTVGRDGAERHARNPWHHSTVAGRTTETITWAIPEREDVPQGYEMRAYCRTARDKLIYDKRWSTFFDSADLIEDLAEVQHEGIDAIRKRVKELGVKTETTAKRRWWSRHA